MNTRLVFAFATALASAACSSPDDASGDFHLELVQAPTTATPGSAAPQSVLVRVVNGDGTSITGVPVTWNIRSGGGHLTPSADTSGVDGLAAAQWTAGLATGSQAIGASIFGQPALTISVSTDAFRADKITTAYRSGCGLRGTAVYCWDYGSTTATVRRILPERQVSDLALSLTFLCVLEKAGTVYCQRAFGDPGSEPMGTVQGLPPLSALSGGNGFCGLAAADGTAWCWDRQRLVASQKSVMPFAHVDGDGARGCGLTSGGAAWCWTFGPNVPQEVAGGLVFRTISAGNSGICGIVSPTRLYCWDYDNLVPASFGIEASQIALGGSAGLVNGSLGAQEFYFWSLQPPLYDLHSAFPMPVVQISSQDDTPCVIAYDAAVYCLGINDNIEQVYKSTWEAIPPPQP